MDGLFFLLFLAGATLLWLSRRWAADAGLPHGRLISVDLERQGQAAPTLIDPDLGLTGRPDALLETRRGRVPVEIKSGPAPDQPHPSHVLQLMAYCRLVQAAFGRRPPYGILNYADRAFEVPYSRRAEAALRRAVKSMHALGADLPDRSHRDPARCAGCGFAAACDQRLAPADGGWL
jgi:CRISPR-associated exonuclease Cas4